MKLKKNEVYELYLKIRKEQPLAKDMNIFEFLGENVFNCTKGRIYQIIKAKKQELLDKSGEEEEEIPTYKIEFEDQWSWGFTCPKCKCIHWHGKIPGHRIAHCDMRCNFHPNGYYIIKDEQA